VHLRRALLLFAIVLGLAAVAASVSRPRDAADPLREPSPTTEAEQPPTAAPKQVSTPVELTFSESDPRAQRIRPGQAATIYVDVSEAGQVEIADLGMSAAAEPLSPARFDVFTRALGRHPITFVPAGAEREQVRLGTLVVADER
jgi:hypothetical protein